jgi:hypothetical protein
VHLTFIFAYAMLAEAALSFLGVGIQPPIASWGNIIAEGRDYATEAWWVMLFPGHRHQPRRIEPQPARRRARRPSSTRARREAIDLTAPLLAIAT